MATLTLLIILIGFLMLLSYTRDLEEQVKDLKRYVGNLEKPVCNFIKGYKGNKVETRAIKKEEDNGNG